MWTILGGPNLADMEEQGRQSPGHPKRTYIKGLMGVQENHESWTT